MKRDIKLNNFIMPIFLGMLVLISLSGCKKDTNSFDPNLALATESLSVSNQANNYSVDMVSNLPWTAESDVDWITVNPSSGEKGKGKMTFSVSKSEEDERIGTITISTSADYKKQITVTQESGLSADMYVKVDGTGSGMSWEDATTLSNALKLVPSGSTIYIAAGTHVPTEIITGGDSSVDGDITFEINKYITLKGGYPANATEGAEADPVNNKTLLSGKLPNGSETYHVVTVTAPRIEGQKVVIDGVTISHGNAGTPTTSANVNGTNFRRDYGGGLVIGNAIVDILNTEISNNKSAKFVAGVRIFGESIVTMRNSKVHRNISVSNGGGLWADNSTVYIYDSEFTENETPGTAAGIHGYPDANIYMYNSTVANNKGNSYGAGLYIRQNSNAVLVNCLIYGNITTSANGGGGIMMYSNTKLDLISSTVVDNEARGPGGGIYRRADVNELSIYNSIISGNAQASGSSDVAVFEANAQAPLVRSTVIGSKAYSQSGAEIAGANFNVSSMLNASYLPVGADNPALDNGMTGSELNSLANTFNPVLEAFISSDYNGRSRSGFTIMGALVQ